jgi:cbb3-type cytochrome oxidase maturation protein
VETVFVLLPLALLIAAVAVGFFIWAARTGQFDDLETPPVRILFDDDPPPRSPGAVREASEAKAGQGTVSQDPDSAASRQPPVVCVSSRRVSE